MVRNKAQKIVTGQIIKERKRKALGDNASAKRLRVSKNEINSETQIDFNNPLVVEKVNYEMERILSEPKKLKKVPLGNI